MKIVETREWVKTERPTGLGGSPGKPPTYVPIEIEQNLATEGSEFSVQLDGAAEFRSQLTAWRKIANKVENGVRVQVNEPTGAKVGDFAKEKSYGKYDGEVVVTVRVTKLDPNDKRRNRPARALPPEPQEDHFAGLLG